MRRHAIDGREAFLGGGLVVLAVAVVVPTVNMPVGFSYDGVGPRTFPYAIAGLLLIGGLAILWSAFADRRAAAAAADGPLRWGPVAVISAVLLLQMVLIRPLGWIPVASVSFAAVAWAFGSRQVLLGLAFGFALACATFVLFNYGLGLTLPAGFF